jgi:large conductance mechanosensitive channel
MDIRTQGAKGLSFVREFKAFAMRGNVVDLAVGIVIGGAFGKIVTSMVSDVLMPPIGALIGGADFSDLVLTLGANPLTQKAIEIRYGAFINSLIDFAIVAFAIFLVVKAMNRMKRAEPAPPPAAPTSRPCPECLMEIPLAAKRCGHCTSLVK